MACKVLWDFGCNAPTKKYSKVDWEKYSKVKLTVWETSKSFAMVKGARTFHY